MLIFGVTRAQVEKQLACDHQDHWSDACMDAISRYRKCMACFVLDRDMSEKEYIDASREAITDYKAKLAKVKALYEEKIRLLERKYAIEAEMKLLESEN